MAVVNAHRWLAVLALAIVVHLLGFWLYEHQPEKGLINAKQDAGVVAFELALTENTLTQSMPKPAVKTPPPVVKQPEPETPLPEPQITEIEADVVVEEIIKETPIEKVEEKPPEEVTQSHEQLVQAEPPPLVEPVIESVAPVEPKMPVESETPVTAESNANTLAGGNQGLVDDYYARLSTWLERHKTYPRRAQRRGQEGTSHLRFKIDQQGALISYHIEKSSGFDLLDKEVEKMLKRALPLPVIPAELGQSTLELVLPVSFNLH